jgi:hypothetical protein
MSRICVAIIVMGIMGCGRDTVPQVSSTPDTSSPEQMVVVTEGHAGHENVNHSVSTSSLVRDTGWDDLKPGNPVKLQFHLETNGQRIRDFSLLHEKFMHFIVVRDALDEFQHLHPTLAPDGGVETEIVFPSSGTYWIFVDFQGKGEKQQTVRQEIQIAGVPPTTSGLQPDIPVTVKSKKSRTTVSAEPSNEEWIFTFAHSTMNGEPLSDLQPYLGAMGHLVVIGEKTGEYVHAHAETESAPDGKVKFAAHIKRPGIYKVWGQFQRQGEVFTIPAVLRVE